MVSYYPATGEGVGGGRSGASRSEEWRSTVLARFCSIARKYPEKMNRVVEERDDSSDDALSPAMTDALKACRSAREWSSQAD